MTTAVRKLHLLLVPALAMPLLAAGCINEFMMASGFYEPSYGYSDSYDESYHGESYHESNVTVVNEYRMVPERPAPPRQVGGRPSPPPKAEVRRAYRPDKPPMAVRSRAREGGESLARPARAVNRRTPEAARAGGEGRSRSVSRPRPDAPASSPRPRIRHSVQRPGPVPAVNASRDRPRAIGDDASGGGQRVRRPRTSQN